VNYEAVNRYALIALVVFAALLYIGLFCAGFGEFMTRISKRGNRKKRLRDRRAARSLRDPKKSILP
jgi:hypothetical protein